MEVFSHFSEYFDIRTLQYLNLIKDTSQPGIRTDHCTPMNRTPHYTHRMALVRSHSHICMLQDTSDGCEETGGGRERQEVSSITGGVCVYQEWTFSVTYHQNIY